MPAIFGLDFGTTNSSLSVNKDGGVHIIDIDRYNPTGKTLRSILYFDEDLRVHVGQKAIDQYIEEDACGRLMQSIKTFLPHMGFDYLKIGGLIYGLEDLIAIILKKIKETGECSIGEQVDSVVMGRPVVFSEDAKKDKLAEERLMTAAQKAGFKNIFFQLEPIAAALTFEQTLQSDEEKIVLVGDFGGGTSDFSIIRLRGDRMLRIGTDHQKDILSLGGIYIGGDTFDSQVMWHKIARYFGKDVRYKTITGEWVAMPYSITRTLCQWHLVPRLRDKKICEYIRQIKMTADNIDAITNLQNIIEDNYGFMLFQSIEKAKCDLSSYDNSQIVFDEKDLTIREDITKIEFEQIIIEDVEKIDKCLTSLLDDAGLTADDVDTVFLTGGTSHIPFIKRIFIDRFGEEKMKYTDAFTSVAYGLGVSGSLFR